MTRDLFNLVLRKADCRRQPFRSVYEQQLNGEQKKWRRPRLGRSQEALDSKNLVLETRHGGDRFKTRWIILSTIGNI